VFVEDYDNTAPWTSTFSGPDDTLPTVARVAARETFFSIRPTSNEMCSHFSWEAHKGEGVWESAMGKCMKRHRSVYKLEAIREPVGFKIVVPNKRMTRRSGQQQHAPLRYLMSPGTIQGVNNSIY
jgi:hypothetical protein